MLTKIRCFFFYSVIALFGACAMGQPVPSHNAAKAQNIVDPDKFKKVLIQHSDLPRLHEAILKNDASSCIALLENGASLTEKNHTGLNALQFGIKNHKNQAVKAIQKYQKNLFSSLKKAIFNGEKAVLQILLKNGIRLSQKDIHGFTPLHYAAISGHRHIVSILLSQHVDLDQRDFSGKTALHHASFHRHSSVVLDLINQGAQVNTSDQDGITPLHECAITGDQRTCSILLQHGADPQKTDRFGKTAQDDAKQYKHIKIYKMLAQKGQKPIKKINDAFLDAAQKKDLRSLKKLAIHAHINAVNTKGQTALHLAVKNNDLAMARWLLEHHAKVNARKIDQETPLHEAAWSGHADMVNLLLENGAFIDAVNRYQMTPLQIASWEGHLSVVQALINENLPPELNADPNLLNQHGWTALHFATKYNHNDIVKWLLAHHANPDIQERLDGNTPLHQAVFHQNPDVFKTLLSHGAKVDVENHKQQTPLKLAQRISKHHPYFEQALIDALAFEWKPLASEIEKAS